MADTVDFFHLDALSAGVTMQINVDVQLTVMASALYRLLARHIRQPFENQKPAHRFRQFMQAAATMEITKDDIFITFGRRTYNPYLPQASMLETTPPLPGLDGRNLRLRNSK